MTAAVSIMSPEPTQMPAKAKPRPFLRPWGSHSLRAMMPSTIPPMENNVQISGDAHETTSDAIASPLVCCATG